MSLPSTGLNLQANVLAPYLWPIAPSRAAAMPPTKLNQRSKRASQCAGRRRGGRVVTCSALLCSSRLATDLTKV